MWLHMNMLRVWAFFVHIYTNIKFSKFTHSHLFLFISQNNNILKTFIFPGEIGKSWLVFVRCILWLLFLSLSLFLPESWWNKFGQDRGIRLGWIESCIIQRRYRHDCFVRLMEIMQSFDLPYCCLSYQQHLGIFFKMQRTKNTSKGKQR